MKTNQLLLTGIRSLVSLVFVAFLGVMIGNYTRNSNLLIKLDDAIVNQNEINIVNPILANQKSGVVLDNMQNTCTSMERMMNAAYLNQERLRLNMSIPQRAPEFSKVLQSRPPRNDTIINTS